MKNKVIEIKEPHGLNAKNYHEQKMLVKSFLVVAFKEGMFMEPIEVRCWMAKTASAQTVYASIWVRSKMAYVSGRGQASGYASMAAAVAAALDSAGIVMELSVARRGDDAIEGALAALATHLGFEKFTVITQK